MFRGTQRCHIKLNVFIRDTLAGPLPGAHSAKVSFYPHPLLPPAPHPQHWLTGACSLGEQENKPSLFLCRNLSGEFGGENRVPYPLGTTLLRSEPVGKAEGKWGGPFLLIPQLSRAAPSSSHSLLLDSLCFSGFPTHLLIPPVTAYVKATI